MSQHKKIYAEFKHKAFDTKIFSNDGDFFTWFWRRSSMGFEAWSFWPSMTATDHTQKKRGRRDKKSRHTGRRKGREPSLTSVLLASSVLVRLAAASEFGAITTHTEKTRHFTQRQPSSMEKERRYFSKTLLSHCYSDSS